MPYLVRSGDTYLASWKDLHMVPDWTLRRDHALVIHSFEAASRVAELLCATVEKLEFPYVATKH
jgi:hypothetical protein